MGYFSARNKRIKEREYRKENNICISCGKCKSKKYYCCITCRKKTRKRNNEKYKINKWKYQNASGAGNLNKDTGHIFANHA